MAGHPEGRHGDTRVLLDALSKLGQERKIQIGVAEIELLADLEIVGNLTIGLDENRDYALALFQPTCLFDPANVRRIRPSGQICVEIGATAVLRVPASLEGGTT